MITVNDKVFRDLGKEVRAEFMRDREIVEKEVIRRPGMAIFAAVCFGILIGIAVKR
jgi:hypothetical protein